MEKKEKKPLTAAELALKYEEAIKDTVLRKFNVPPTSLRLVLEDENGAYFSEKEERTHCTFVVGTENGFLYLVTAEISEDGQSLDAFRSDIVS